MIVALLVQTSGSPSPSGPPTPAFYYAAPWVASGGSGTFADPWPLSTALTDANVPDGATVWLRGGAYLGPFQSTHSGTASAMKTVRSYPNERAVLVDYAETGSSGVLRTMSTGAYTIYRDLWVTNLNEERTFVSQASQRRLGVEFQSPNSKLLNSVILNANHGVGLWAAADGSELHGLVIANGGEHEAGNRGHGHGVYTQGNASDSKTIDGNIVVNQMGWGLQGYPNPDSVIGYQITRNILAENGRWYAAGSRNNQIIVDVYSPYTADEVVVDGNFIRSNITNLLETWRDAAVNMGEPDTGTFGDATLTNNVIWGGSPAILEGDLWSTFTASGNTTTAGSGPAVYYVKNDYEADRGHIAIFNYTSASTVDVDLSTFMLRGTEYEIRNAMDFTAGPIASGTWDGSTPVTISFPLDVRAPYGFGSDTTQSDFAALLVTRPWVEHAITELDGYYDAAGDISEIYISGSDLVYEDVNDSTLARLGGAITLDKITDQVWRLPSLEATFTFYNFSGSEAQNLMSQSIGGQTVASRHTP